MYDHDFDDCSRDHEIDALAAWRARRRVGVLRHRFTRYYARRANRLIRRATGRSR